MPNIAITDDVKTALDKKRNTSVGQVSYNEIIKALLAFHDDVDAQRERMGVLLKLPEGM